MIYQKRGTNESIKTNSHHSERALSYFDTRQSTSQTKAEKTPLTDTAVFERINTKRKKTKSRTVSALLFAVLIFSAALCFAKKPALTPFINSLKDEFSSIFEKDEGFIFSESFSPVEARTLYTVEYKNQEASSQNPPDAKTSSAGTDDSTDSVIVQQSKAEIYSDGIKYYPITELDLSGDVLSLSNETHFSVDTASLLEKTPAALENVQITDDPLVLIIHTHAGECYTTYEGMYPENEPTRDYEGDNILQIGREVKNALSDFGICAIHCENMHDKESFINAYSSSAKTVKQYLEEYPSIRFVIDIHRDAIIRDDGESIKPVAYIAGQKYAQLMLVVGTDERGHNHPLWQENLSLALNLMQKTEEYYPGLFRSINLRDVPFNQQLSCGYLLLETGSNANLKDEALLSARAFAQGLSALIYDA